MSTKEVVLSRICDMPETATYADIHSEIEKLEILEACEEGLNDFKNGRVKSQEEVRKLVSQWTTN